MKKAIKIIICGIYKITNPNGKVYIGKSKNIYKRVVSYRNYFCQKQIKLYNSLKKYGWENHNFQIIEECLFSELRKRERFWQDFYDVLNPEKGLNLVLTKTDEEDGVLTEEGKAKISAKVKEHWKSIINYIYQYNLDGKLIKVWDNWTDIRENSPYTVCSILKCTGGSLDKAYGFLWSKELKVFSNEFLEKVNITTIEKMKQNNLKKDYEKINQNRTFGIFNKTVIQYDLDMNFIKEWCSATEAGKYLKILSQNISTCCVGKGKQKTAGGFIWKFKEII